MECSTLLDGGAAFGVRRCRTGGGVRSGGLRPAVRPDAAGSCSWRSAFVAPTAAGGPCHTYSHLPERPPTAAGYLTAKTSSVHAFGRPVSGS